MSKKAFKIAFLMLTMSLCFIAVNIVYADGGYLPPYHDINQNIKVEEPNQRAIIFWDGVNETMLVSSGLKADQLANFVWILPIQSSQKPEVTKGDVSIFNDLERWLGPYAPRVYGRGPDMSMGLGGYKTVEVVETKKIDFYDLTILRATDTKDLINWLNDNKYFIPSYAEEIFDKYVKQGNYYFVANKINLSAQNISKNIFRVTLNSVVKLFNLLVHRNNTLVDLRDLNSLQAALAKGITTPLKIKFQPTKPYYPLEISRLNPGETYIQVYVLGAPASYIDYTGILERDTTDDLIGAVHPDRQHQLLKEQLRNKIYKYFDSSNIDPVTRFVYRGDSSGLISDAFFEWRDTRKLEINPPPPSANTIDQPVVKELLRQTKSPEETTLNLDYPIIDKAIGMELNLEQIGNNYADIEINYSDRQAYPIKRVFNDSAENPEIANQNLVDIARRVYRMVRNCNDRSVVNDGSGYQIIESSGGHYTTGYTCTNRFQQQCILDGTFDRYYDERCDYGKTRFSVGATAQFPDFTITLIKILSKNQVKIRISYL